ncbi:TPA: MucBP domain-containing protein, partial [Streptococcus suis]|nr:MucBP domain-containing protein [Streptococcus suis]
MNRKYIFSKIAEAEGRQRMVKTKAYGLIGAIILAGAFDLFNVSTVEAAEIKSGFQNTPISRTAITSLTAEQQSQIIAGEITEVPMSWINAETGNVQWITSFTLVYKLNGEVVTVPVEPGTVTPPTPTSSPLAKLLPNTGTAASTVITLAGVGLVGFAGWLAFRNKKSGKIFLVSLCVAGGIATSLTALAAEVDFLSIVDTVSIELSSHFSHTAATHEDWEYVGYIPTIAEESVKETTTTGSVNVKYVDTEGNEINDLYNLVVDGIVSTTTTTTTTTDGVASVTEDTVASGLTYDATTQKPTSITSNGKVYELVQVKDGDVEQGLVSEGTTTVTYIYRHVPQVTTDVKTSTTTGSVNVRYVDTEGNEIKDLYNLVVDGIVSTTTTTTTTTDGVASVTEDTVASGLNYDATAQKPTSITSNGKVYELVQVKDGDVEQGLVSEGTTTVTYIYRHVPQVTTDVKTSTTT